MLQTLSIKNVALIKDLSIDFGDGFNVLLGETGAGKSIIFDSINFVLGGKLDKTLLRSGETLMRVDALFNNINSQSQEKLRELGFEGEEFVLTRTYSEDGKSSCRINSMPCVTNTLKEVGSLLLDSYSQHENIELLKTKNHLTMLDKFGGKQILETKDKLKEAYNKYLSLNKQIDELGGDEGERERTKSLLTYQIDEIEKAELKIGEDEELQQRLKFLNNAEKIFEAVSQCEEYLSESSSSAINNLQQASYTLASISIDRILDCKERLDSARIEIEDVYETLLQIKEESEFDEKEYNALDNRLDLIKSLNKKYGGSIEKTLDFLKQSKEKLNILNDSEYMLAKLSKEKDEQFNEVKKIANDLSELRKITAKSIESKIIGELRELGMKSSQFEVKFNLLQEPNSNGQDDVEFVFSANKGQDVKSLSKTASGGELSRFMLAVKNIFAEIGGNQTLIFDEIDSGISGETGNIVGSKLNNITKFAQIICITHLPQVAVFGDDFFLVTKSEDVSSTHTEVKHLEKDEIPTQIAKIFAGSDISENAIKQVVEMRKKAGKSE